MIGLISVGGVLVVFLMMLAIGYICYRKSHAKNLKRQSVEYNRDNEVVNITTQEQVPPESRPRRTPSTSSAGSAAAFLRQRSMRSRLESRLTQLSEVEIAYDPDWEVDRNDVILCEVLGEGAFGKVNKAQAYGTKGSVGSTIVAVKMLKGLFPLFLVFIYTSKNNFSMSQIRS
jgi:hypothetical protein